MELIVALIVGVLVGGVACWWVQESRAKSQLAEAERKNQETLAAADLEHQKTVAEQRETVAGLRGQLEQVDSAQKILDAAKEQLSETFQATASRALQSNNEQFMTLAQENLGKTLETAKGEFNQRHEQFQALVKPLAQNYEKLNPNIESLIQQSRSLAAETGKLSGALTNNRQVGNWGEIQLRRVVELAGMVEHCDFAEQSSMAGGSQRPDLIVKLPDNRMVIVDAKTSAAAYLEAQQEEDEIKSADALTRHARALRTQVDELAGKNYGAQMQGSLDFVVMFVPGDQFLAAALNANPNLVDYAMAKRVAIATPASLISLLWTVANGWDRYRIAESAESIRQAGEEMHKRMMTFMRHYQNVGKELDSAIKAYNSSVGSFDRSVVPQGRKFAELVKGSETDFGEMKAIEGDARVSRYADEPAPSLPSSD